MTSIQPQSFDFFGNTVYNAQELKDFDPLFFIGCSRGVRKIIDKHNIQSDTYFYGFNYKDTWK